MDATQKLALLAACQTIVDHDKQRTQSAQAAMLPDRRIPADVRKRLLIHALHEARAQRDDDDTPS